MRAFADSTGPGHHPRGLPGGLSGSAEFDFRVFLVPSPRPRPRGVSYAKQPLNEAAIAGSKGCRPPADFAERRGAKCRWQGWEAVVRSTGEAADPCAHPAGLTKSRPIACSGGSIARPITRVSRTVGAPISPGCRASGAGRGGPLVQTWFKGNAGESPASGLHRLCGSAVCSNGGLNAAGDHMGLAIHSRAAPVDVFSGLLWFRAPAERCLPAT